MAESADRAGAPAPDKYWVFFKDRPGSNDGTTSLERVTQRAHERRRLRGIRIADRSDEPVSPVYVAALRREGIVPVHESRWLNAVSAVLTPAQVEKVRSLAFVRTVRAVRTFETARFDEAASATPLPVVTRRAENRYGFSATQLALMNAIDPLDQQINGMGVRLGFLDTRFDFQHPAFRNLVQSGRLIAVKDFTRADQDYSGGNQTNFHGLNTTSVAVGFSPDTLVGPAFGAEVLAGTTEFGSHERNTEEDNLVAGLEWMEAQGADVVNISLGYTVFDPGQRSYTPADMDGDTAPASIAADMAVARGMVVVASAGNEGCGSPEQCWYYIGSPADGDSVIAVGAVAPDSSRAPFSSFGIPGERIKPDVAALGQAVVMAATAGRYQYASGTSFSGPLVAGVVCQMLQVNPRLTPAQVADILRSTAGQAGNPDYSLGWGIVNAAAAIQAARNIAEVPESVQMVRPFPNPVSQNATFEIDAPENPGEVRLFLYDAAGRRILPPLDASLQSGFNRIHVPVDRLADGVYFYLIQGQDFRETGPVVVVH